MFIEKNVTRSGFKSLQANNKPDTPSLTWLARDQALALLQCYLTQIMGYWVGTNPILLIDGKKCTFFRVNENKSGYFL